MVTPRAVKRFAIPLAIMVLIGFVASGLNSGDSRPQVREPLTEAQLLRTALGMTQHKHLHSVNVNLDTEMGRRGRGDKRDTSPDDLVQSEKTSIVISPNPPRVQDGGIDVEDLPATDEPLMGNDTENGGRDIGVETKEGDDAERGDEPEEPQQLALPQEQLDRLKQLELEAKQAKARHPSADVSNSKMNGEADPLPRADKARYVYPEPRLAILVVTGGSSEKTLSNRKAVLETWGNSEHVYFVTHDPVDVPKSRIIWLPDAAEVGGRSMLGRKVIYMWDYVANNEELLAKYDFFMKADDDVFLNMPKLKQDLRYFNGSTPLSLGNRRYGVGMKGLPAPNPLFQARNYVMFAHGGAGYILSRATLELMKGKFDNCFKGVRTSLEDAKTAACIYTNTGVDSIDIGYHVSSVGKLDRFGNRHDQQKHVDTLASVPKREILVAGSFHSVQSEIIHKLNSYLYDDQELYQDVLREADATIQSSLSRWYARFVSRKICSYEWTSLAPSECYMGARRLFKVAGASRLLDVEAMANDRPLSFLSSVASGQLDAVCYMPSLTYMAMNQFLVSQWNTPTQISRIKATDAMIQFLSPFVNNVDQPDNQDTLLERIDNAYRKVFTEGASDFDVAHPPLIELQALVLKHSKLTTSIQNNGSMHNEPGVDTESAQRVAEFKRILTDGFQLRSSEVPDAGTSLSKRIASVTRVLLVLALPQKGDQQSPPRQLQRTIASFRRVSPRAHVVVVIPRDVTVPDVQHLEAFTVKVTPTSSSIHAGLPGYSAALLEATTSVTSSLGISPHDMLSAPFDGAATDHGNVDATKVSLLTVTSGTLFQTDPFPSMTFNGTIAMFLASPEKWAMQSPLKSFRKVLMAAVNPWVVAGPLHLLLPFTHTMVQVHSQEKTMASMDLVQALTKAAWGGLLSGTVPLKLVPSWSSPIADMTASPKQRWWSLLPWTPWHHSCETSSDSESKSASDSSPESPFLVVVNRELHVTPILFNPTLYLREIVTTALPMVLAEEYKDMPLLAPQDLKPPNRPEVLDVLTRRRRKQAVNPQHSPLAAAKRSI
eukprot:m.14599 g.14599  ORF g.14599 m.14599 type:complete len:1054 (-) comp6371_c0_seq1:243-3404(-)